MSRTVSGTYCFGVVVVRHPDGRFLAVKETKNRGWWLPAGGVDEGESFAQGALRETLEEAGLKVVLKGVLRVEHSGVEKVARMRVVFYAEPLDPSAPPKSVPDRESEGAAWMTLDELKKLRSENKLRGTELLDWALYLEEGGLIYPMSVFSLESDDPSGVQSAAAFAKLQPKSGIEVKGDTDGKLLEAAVLQGSVEQAKAILVSNPRAVNIRVNGEKQWSLLHFAVNQNNAEMAKLLIEYKIDINTSTHKGRTPLHMAVVRSVGLTKLLLDNGACPFMADCDGQLALHAVAPFVQRSKVAEECYEYMTKYNPEVAGILLKVKNKVGHTPTDLLGNP